MKINPLIIYLCGVVALLGSFVFSFVIFHNSKKEVLNYQNQRSNDSLMLDSYFQESDLIQKTLDTIMNMEETLRERNILKQSAIEKLASIQSMIKEKLGVIETLESRAKKKKSIFPVQYIETKKEELTILQHRYLELEIYIKNLREEKLDLKTKLDSAMVKVNNRSITIHSQKQRIDNLESNIAVLTKKINEKERQLEQSKTSSTELKIKTGNYYYEIACNLKDDADKTWKLLNSDRKKARTKLAYSLFTRAQELGNTKAKDKIKEIESDKTLNVYVKK